MAKQPSSKPAQSPSGSRRERLRQEQLRLARERRIRTGITIGVVGVAVLALVGVLIWVIVAASTNKPDEDNSSTNDATYTLTIGNDSAPVTVDIYQDFMCPYCGQFDRANQEDLNKCVADGTAKIVLHPMAFLDDQSQGTQFSTRAANALVTVAKLEADKVMAFNEAIFANQPGENTPGLSDDQIAEYARSAGVSDATIQQFGAKKYTDFVAKATQAAFDEGIESTPTIKVNGKKFDGNLLTAGPLKSAIDEAAKASGADNSSQADS